jgi:broad specificity phosphatase PhoE
VRETFGAIERHNPKGNVLVVCHGGVISTYSTMVLNLPADDIWCLTVKNASLTMVDVGLDTRTIVTFNNIDHLMQLKELKKVEVTHVA